MARPLFPAKSDGGESWISVSDLMAGLMMVFLFIAVIYAKDANQRAQNVTEIVNEWKDTELAIYQALEREFRADLAKWNAEIEKETLTIRFLSPEILFESGKADLTPTFQEVLNDFMPRYVQLLYSDFQTEIDEIRIEGHTSSRWSSAVSINEAFIKNMSLSQERTRSVLDYSLNLPRLFPLTPWMTKTISANGLSSARLIETDGIEDERRSRRVEFTVKTKAKEALFRILEKVAPGVSKKL